MVELDNLDVKILTYLQGDSRKSFQEIAKACLTSVPTIKSRVDRLVELGIIKKFTIDIDNSRGYAAYPGNSGQDKPHGYEQYPRYIHKNPI